MKYENGVGFPYPVTLRYNEEKKYIVYYGQGIEEVDATGGACLVGDSLIETDMGVKRIDEIKLQDKVLSHNGEYNPVTKLYNREFQGDLVEIHTGKLGKVSLTPEHPVLVLRNGHCRQKREDSFKWETSLSKLKSEWVNAGDLTKKDVILYPQNKTIKSQEKLKIPELKKKISSKIKWELKDIPSEIDIDEDFLLLSGYYIAEGYSGEKRLGFALHIKEKDIEADICRIIKNKFNLICSIQEKEKSHSEHVRVCSIKLSSFFQNLFGKGAENKHIPEEFMWLEQEKQKALIRGLWKGDGYISNKQATYATISFVLAHQLKRLLMRQGIIVSFNVVKEKIGHRRSYYLTVQNPKEISILKSIIENKEISISTNKKNRFGVDDNYFYLPILSLKKKKFEGTVYNLEVDKTHSYCSTSAILHNCVMFKRKVYEAIERPYEFQYYRNGTLALTCDFDVFQKCQKAGFKLWIDFSLICDHIRTVSIKSVNDLMIKEK
jgi:intein/homing endonuclease